MISHCGARELTSYDVNFCRGCMGHILSTVTLHECQRSIYLFQMTWYHPYGTSYRVEVHYRSILHCYPCMDLPDFPYKTDLTFAAITKTYMYTLM